MPDHDDDSPPQPDDTPWAPLEDVPSPPAGPPSSPSPGPSPAPPFETAPLNGDFQPSLTPEQQSMQAARAAWAQSRPKAGSARTGPLPLHPMTLSDILDGAFKLYKANARSVILITAAFVVPVQLAAAFLQRNILGGQSIITAFNDPSAVSFDQGSGRAEDVGALIVVLTSLLVMPFVAGAISRVVAGSYLGHEIAPGEALRATGRRWWALTAAWFLVHLLEGVGVLLCIFPAFLVMALFVAVAPAIVVEELGPIKGMKRSARLMKPRIWAVLGIALLSGLLASIIGSALGFIPQMAALLVGFEWGWLLLAAGSILVGIVTTPFVAIVATLIYFDGRIRWEGFDLAVMAGDLRGRG